MVGWRGLAIHNVIAEAKFVNSTVEVEVSFVSCMLQGPVIAITRTLLLWVVIQFSWMQKLSEIS